MPDIVKIREIVKSGNPLDWENVWRVPSSYSTHVDGNDLCERQANLTPWDAGEYQPPLREVIESKDIDLPRQGRALVPGCGSGYDVFYLASALNMETLGLDVSEMAITKARSLESSLENPGSGQVSFVLEDFFHYKPEEKFDLAYDYGFFIVIPPTRRIEWAQQMASLIKSGGFLVTLVFPIDPPTNLGPPFFVRVEHYEEILGGSFKKILDKVPTSSLPSHIGKERIVVWKRI